MFFPEYLTSIKEAPTQPTYNLVSQFEMQETGLPATKSLTSKYAYSGSGYDPKNPFEGRDPRLRKSIFLDGDTLIQNPSNIEDPEIPAIAEFHRNGYTYNAYGIITSFMVKKFAPEGLNIYDQDWSQFRYVVPKIRLADIYLIYAEAVYQWKQSMITIPGKNELGVKSAPDISPLDAVNIIRERAHMPKKTTSLEGYSDGPLSKYGDFMHLIENEREVELCFEAKNWYDIRRWHVAHENIPKYNSVYDFKFYEDYSISNVIKVSDRIFKQKHYWLPIPGEETQMSQEFSQNPDW